MDEREYIISLSKMSLNSFVLTYRKMTEEEKSKLLSNPYLNELSDSNFRSLFLQIDDEIKKQLLSNKQVYNHVLNIPINKMEKDIFSLLSLEVLKTIFESEYSILYLNRITNYLKGLNREQLQEVSNNINFSKIYSIFPSFSKPESLYYALNIDDDKSDVVNQFYNKIKTEQLNPIGLMKVENYNQFLIYTKFNLLVNVEQNSENIILNNGLVIPINKIENISEGKVNKIITLLRKKYNRIENEELLEISLKLYCIFGYDNSKKIIEDKFTNITLNSIQEISNYKFKDLRREYRTSNQNEFYHHEMIEEVINGLFSSNDEIFIRISGSNDSNIIKEIIEEFRNILKNNNDSNQLRIEIKNKINEIINLRENILKQQYYDDLFNKLNINLTSRNELSKNKLISLLSNIDLKKVMNEYDSDTLINLQSFLLGNGKHDNNCLFRLIANNEANGLLLSNLINKYKLLDSLALKNQLSLNSILDVIDLMKINCYSLKPNEMDISLATLSKLVTSKNYCNADEQEILKQTFKLHADRKKKVYSSIPSVSGQANDIEYRVLSFDDEKLLALGSIMGNCLKISGPGEEFLKYCLTSEHAVIVELTDLNGKQYMCPVIRSGNAINCNGIDPEPPKQVIDDLLGSLTECFKKMINESYNISENHAKNIEIATITDLHMEDHMYGRYEKYDLQEYIPLNSKCYCDFNKNDIYNYVLAKSPTYSKNEYYLSNDRYYQKRNSDYEYQNVPEFDKEKISNIINSIAYSTIDYKELNNEQKNSMRRKFKPINMNDFNYVIGNKDWYIAIDNQFNVVGNLLPYDERAKEDYIKAYQKIQKLMEEKINGKDR